MRNQKTNLDNFHKLAEASIDILLELRAQERVFAENMTKLGFIRQEVGGSITYSMSQRRRAEQILEKLRLLPNEDMRKLREVLSDAQNAPPLGDADGSINEESFNKLREVEASLCTINSALETFKRSLS